MVVVIRLRLLLSVPCKGEVPPAFPPKHLNWTPVGTVPVNHPGSARLQLPSNRRRSASRLRLRCAGVDREFFRTLRLSDSDADAMSRRFQSKCGEAGTDVREQTAGQDPLQKARGLRDNKPVSAVNASMPNKTPAVGYRVRCTSNAATNDAASSRK